MIKVKRKVIILSVIILGFLFYYYPLQRIGAEIKFWQYTKEQGLSKEEIISKHARKNHKQDGYYIIVQIKNDEKHEYRYRYYLIKNRKQTGWRIHEMDCVVYEENVRLEDYTDVLYPPLE